MTNNLVERVARALSAFFYNVDCFKSDNPVSYVEGDYDFNAMAKAAIAAMLQYRDEAVEVMIDGYNNGSLGKPDHYQSMEYAYDALLTHMEGSNG